MAPFDDVQKRGAVVDVDAGQRASSLAALRDLDAAPRRALLGPGEHEAESPLDQGRQGLAPALGLPLGAQEQGVVQTDRGSHMSTHTLDMSVCQAGWPPAGRLPFYQLT
jgi:hypothetical protein